MFKIPVYRFLLGLGLCSLGGAMLYVYFKNRDEDDNNDTIDGTISKSNSSKKMERIKIQFVVLNETVPILIGRNSANLKIIEDKTGTVINFREKDDNHHYCEISGIEKSVMEAKDMLMKDIQKSSMVQEEIFIPQSACGKIIGICSEALQEICRKSLAKVTVDSGDRSHGSTTRRVLIAGNRNQVNIAKKLIEEKVKEDEEFRKSVEQVVQKREPRRSPTSSVSSNHSSMTSSVISYLPSGEKLIMSENEKPLEVYVSAIASPSKFWLQLVGPQSQKLDELVENMTEYYNKEENKSLHKIADPYLGQIVAALFKYDGKWYRAEIVGILPNEYNPRDVVLDLYFVDYGDSEYIAPNEVFELRTDFLTLRFQAIECFLAHVKPALPTDNDVWDKQAIEKFEELAHVATWKKLVSRVVTYKNRPKGKNHGKREGSPIPGVQLFDTSGDVEINIAHALITEGFAAPDYQNTDTNVLRLGGGNFNNFHLNETVSTTSLPSSSHFTSISPISNLNDFNTEDNKENNDECKQLFPSHKINSYKGKSESFQNHHYNNNNKNSIALNGEQNNLYSNSSSELPSKFVSSSSPPPSSSSSTSSSPSTAESYLKRNLKKDSENFLHNEITKTANGNIITAVSQQNSKNAKNTIIDSNFKHTIQS